MHEESLLSGTLLALGGLGLFLLGMSVMTEGLRTLADDRLRGLLARWTRSPLSGVITGTISTATLQSSTATTVAVIGFVGSGLMTFPQALGIVFGANLGTSITGWLVVLVGFKLKLGQVALPLVLAGVLMRIFGRRRRAAMGNAIAGFGLLFLGIANLQVGMDAFSDVVTPDAFPSDTLTGRMLLVLIGLAVTVVTQSSSAALAMAVTAVHVGNLSLPQAAAMAIGMNVGTTLTAVVATIGSTVQARRTGIAHLVYNLFIGGGSFLILTPYLKGIDWLAPTLGSSQPEIALVAFYSLCKLLGVIAVLPLTERFAALIEWLVPEQGNPLTRRLESQLTETPDVAISAVQATVEELVSVSFRRLAAALRGDGEDEGSVAETEQDAATFDAIKATEQYLNRIQVDPDDEPLFRREQASIHILDHLVRLQVRLRNAERIRAIRQLETLQDNRERLAATATAIAATPHPIDDTTYEACRKDYHNLKSAAKSVRQVNIAQAASGHHDTGTAIALTDAARGLRRMGYHVWRIVRHLKQDYGEPTEDSSDSAESIQLEPNPP